MFHTQQAQVVGYTFSNYEPRLETQCYHKPSNHTNLYNLQKHLSSAEIKPTKAKYQPVPVTTAPPYRQSSQGTKNMKKNIFKCCSKKRD